MFSWHQYFDAAGLQFGVMLIGFTLVWLILFKLVNQFKLAYRLSLHLFALPLFIFFAKDIFYWASDAVGYSHLEGNAQTWDIFIPAMFYLVLFGFFHALEYYQRSQMRMLAEAEWQSNALKSELKAIKAQLNPHFLYNMFNTINASIPKEQEATRELIADLSDLFRYQLKASEVDSIYLAEEVTSIKTYLRLEKKRFKGRLQLEYEIQEISLNRKIPPMLIQPLVENAIKHGISNLIEGGKVKLQISLNENDLVEVKVSDNGKGIENLDEALENGFGLRFTIERLEKFYNASIKIENLKPQGLMISFSV